MNWFKENPILSSLLLACLLLAGTIGYFASEAAASYSASLEALTSQINSLSNLQKKSPYPTAENLQIITEGRKKYAEALEALKSEMRTKEAPLEPITPQEFQDKLREGVNDLRATAQKNNILLPEKFFFGFDEYQSQLPSPEAAPAFNRDFKVVQTLLKELLDLRVQSINSLERETPPVLPPAPTPTPSPKKSAEPPHPPKPQILATKFKISFTASQDKMREAINMMPKNSCFLIIRSLTLENTKPSAPSKKDPSNSAKDKPPKTLQVLLGNESVKADLSLEIVDFPNPEPAKKQ